MILSNSRKEIKILAVVPARGGSKGIKLKNIKKLNGQPLIFYTADILKRISIIDKTIVSSDNLKIINIAKKFGLEAPFVRPKEISGDNVHDIEVLQHSLKFCEKFYDSRFDIILMLQPTSPVRKKKMITDAIRKLVDKDLDAVWSISKIDPKFNPLKQLKVSDKNILKNFLKEGKFVINRQMLDDTYIRTGQIYAIKRSLIKNGKMFSNKTGFVIEKGFFSNIDSVEDFKNAELYLKNNSNS
tara:strand:+ start:3226 stop:3951 length:726 start_codon:yes stop_codon:yes gene_type:complete